MLHFYLRYEFLFLSVRVFICGGFGIGGSCSFVCDFSKNGLDFIFSFHAVVMVALI